MAAFNAISAMERPDINIWKKFYKDYHQAQEDASSGDDDRATQSGVNIAMLKNKILKDLILNLFKTTKFVNK